jgi:glutamate-1-semialdehyde 2,1-aminomutase
MALELVTELAEVDRRLLERTIDGFLPERIYDIHAHLFHARHFAPGTRPEFLDENRGYGLRDFQEAMERWMPGRKVEGLFFGYPRAGNDRAGENAWLREQVEPGVDNTNTRALVLAAPGDDRNEVHRLLESRVFVGIKPYRLYAEVPDTNEATIESFAPEWMWNLCHEYDGVLMLHIMHAGGITDPRNIEAIRRLAGSFPRCRLVLAHVARSFNYRHAREGLQAIADLDNVVVDTSAVTQAGAFRAALEILGPRRVLWGSDYMVSELRGSCISQGDGFTWIYADDEAAKKLTVFGQYTIVGIESLMCLREACEDLGMTAADRRDIFCDNALRLLAPHLPAAGTPARATGPELWSRAKNVISCGTGLLSKRAHLFDPATWPSYYSRCQGANVWDLDGRRYTDFTGGVGAILLGHGDPEVNAALKRRVNAGTYCTLASPDEVALAERLLALHPWAGKVRFARGGGEALGLAVRIARAASGRSGIAFCGYHGWNDWYLAANLGAQDALDGHLLPGLEPLGVPRELGGTAVPFRYNEPASFQSALEKLGGNLAAIIMEPMRSEWPRNGFLEQVASATRAAGALLVVDEVTSGWRFGWPGACPQLGLTPDMVVYAKAMSNGVPCAAVLGADAAMEPANRSFISSSYWTDGLGPAAALACLGKMEREHVQPHVWNLGGKLQQGLRELAARHQALEIKVAGMPCAPSFAFSLGDLSGAAKAVIIREMLRRGFLFSSQLYVMWPHTEAMIGSLLDALDEALQSASKLHSQGALAKEAGPLPSTTGFARLV